MSRITKAIASDVAKQLVKNQRKELEDLKSKRSEFVTSLYEKIIPEDVLMVFKTNRSYINFQSSIRIVGCGFNHYNNYILTKELPYNGNYLEVDDTDGDIIKSLDAEIDDSRNKIKELSHSIEIALFNLRTYNNVEKEFPEAFKLLPKQSVNTALAINLKDIRCKLDKNNC